MEHPKRGRAAPSRPRFIGAFESTYLPGHGVDVAEVTGHVGTWRIDLAALLDHGVEALRYPLRWHRIEPEPGRFDWSSADPVMAYLHERGADPVIDLVHHTSYPDWLDDGFRDRRFGPAYLRYVEAVARRYPWLRSYSLFNEPFATLFLAGHEALWPPYDRGMAGFVRLLRAVLPPVLTAGRMWRELLPDARHVWVDTAEHHGGTPGGPAGYAALANDRRHVVLDLALQRDLDPARPFLRELLAAGGDALVGLDPVTVDVLGLDYYPHSEWWYDEGRGHSPSPHPIGFAAVAEQYGDRYGLPMLLAETNIRGVPTDRVTWLRHMLEQVDLAVARGVDLDGFCWFPYVDSSDWDSLLARAAGRADPVGVVSLGSGNRRVRTVFTEAWEAAAGGAPAESLPAHRYQSPNDAALAGFAALDPHWPWQDPEPAVASVEAGPDLVVLCHLRWDFVWQRPQHLVSRFARALAERGRRTVFVEEPLVVDDVAEPELRSEERDGVVRMWLSVPRRLQQAVYRGFDLPGTEDYGRLLRARLDELGVSARPDVLLYTPMALDLARALHPGRLFADVMDDLASFRNAPPAMRARQQELLADAAVVFTGGRSIDRGVAAQRQHHRHLFPSGVDVAHYATSRTLRARRRASAASAGPASAASAASATGHVATTPARPASAATSTRPVAGYVGVLDERLDLGLVAGLAAALPDWTLRLVGPLAKIEPEDLPRAPNLEYPGMAQYADLPAVMAGLDVALMPFALNEATRSISPTKTLEYLAAGLPVVSTRVADVVADYADVVHLADDADGFAAACCAALEADADAHHERVRPIEVRQSWDEIARRMFDLMEAGGAAGGPVGAPLVRELQRDYERAHGAAAGAAVAGMTDAALGDLRLPAGAAATLAQAAVSSATPFLRAPLLARMSAVVLLHPAAGDAEGRCPTCGGDAPCDTARALTA